jgi:hypothetical protein
MPASCALGGGPRILIGAACTGDVAQTTFTWALCSCTDVVQETKILTDAYDSAKGPYVKGGRGGGLGLNGTFSLDQTDDTWPSGYTVDVSGSLWASAPAGLTSAAPIITHSELHVGGPLNVVKTTVDKDAWVNGAVAGGPLTIGGKLYQPSSAAPPGMVTYAVVATDPVKVPPPCRCGPGEIVPVRDIAMAHATMNDNAGIKLDPALLAGPSAPMRLDLPCGRYFLNGIDVTRDTAIVAHGHTALFVGGDVTATGKLTITVEAGGELDVFIAGDLRVPNGLDIGSLNHPAASRTYVGGSGEITVNNNTSIVGNFYAANAPIRWSSPTEVHGAVYAGRFNGTSEVQIHYDRQVLGVGCGQPPPPACTSCRDCGNQACVDGTCGACTTSADCCAPLICEGGHCGLLIE